MTSTSSSPALVTGPFDVVALVTSAGGLDALTAVLRDLPAGLPAAVLIVQHPSGQGSTLVEILARRTALPVGWVEDGGVIEVARVQVCPPRKLLEVLPDGTCALLDNERGARDSPLDFFLKSLADSFGSRALAVVLTGTGKDGALGARALKQAGGTVVAQSEETSAHPSMPLAVVESGAADLVLPLDEVGRVLGRVLTGGRFPRPRGEVEGEATTREDEPLQPRAPGARVLVADDNADMRDDLRRLLAPSWQVEVASDGQQALESARRAPPDLIVASVRMPVLDGIALLRHLRQEPALRAVPIILVTAQSGEEAAIEGLLAGADDYLVKPFSARELVARVGGQLELSRVRRRAEKSALVEGVSTRCWAEVERARAVEALRVNERRARIQSEAFQSAMNGEPLTRSLNTLTRIVTEQLGADVRTAFYVAYPDGASLHAIGGAGDMPETYTGALDGFPVGDASFCSGYAIATGRPALTRDVLEDPRWRPYLGLLSAHNIRSASSYPILTVEGRVVGSFAMYFTGVHDAGTQEFAVAEAITQAATIILSRHTEAVARARAEAMLRESEARQAFLLTLSDALRPLTDGAEIERTAMRVLGEEMSVDRAFFATIDPGGESWSIRHDHARGVPSRTGRHPMSAFQRGRLAQWQAGRMSSVADSEADPHLSAAERAAYALEGTRAAIGVPVVKGGRFAALLVVNQGRPREWTEAERSLVAEVAERTWAEVERARAEAALRESEARLAFLFARAPVGLSEIAADGRFVQVNETLCRLVGRPPGAMARLTIADVTHPDDVAPSLAAAARVLTTGEPASLEKRYVRPDGAVVHAESSLARLDKAGRAPGLLAVTVDRTAHRLVEEERARVLAREQEARAEAERAMVLRDEFLAVISHELRTPLSAILLWSRMLSANAVPPAQQGKALASIETSAAAQKQLIEDLLDVSSMLSGKFTLGRREVALGTVVEAAVAAVQPVAASKGVRLTLDPGDEPCEARVDPERLQQVVWNLVSNAVKFTPPGGRAHVQLACHGPLARITVADTGQGIAPAFLPHVFERFRQQDASRTRTHGGLGLGLAIARQLIELHGGTIAADSEGEGQGATFTVELPRLMTPATTASTAPSSPGPAAPPALVLAGKRLLLVEDDASTREALQWMLAQQGAEVTTAASAGEALAACEARGEGGDPPHFDVLVSDLGLPDQDGNALLRALRERPAGRTLPALALTAYARPDDRQRVLAAGFDAYLTKPVEPRALIDTVATLARTPRAGPVSLQRKAPSSRSSEMAHAARTDRWFQSPRPTIGSSRADARSSTAGARPQPVPNTSRAGAPSSSASRRRASAYGTTTSRAWAAVVHSSGAPRSGKRAPSAASASSRVGTTSIRSSAAGRSGMRRAPEPPSVQWALMRAASVRWAATGCTT